MSLWKTLLLVGIVIAGYFFAHRYFELIAIVTGVLWVTEYFRTRHLSTGDKRAEVTLISSTLGTRHRAGLKSIKLRWNSVQMNVSATERTARGRTVAVYDFATPVFRKTPFCFVLRPRKAFVREEMLVENSRIQGVRFEYALTRAQTAPPLEAASNMVTLFHDIQEAAGGLHIDRWNSKSITVQSSFFNGRVCHTHAVIQDDVTPDELRHLLDAHVAFHLTLLDIIDNVDFNVPA
jgi:hypothetical protein